MCMLLKLICDRLSRAMRLTVNKLFVTQSDSKLNQTLLVVYKKGIYILNLHDFKRYCVYRNQ